MLQLAAIRGHEPPGGLFEIRYRTRGGMRQWWRSCDDRPGELAELIEPAARRTDVYIGAAPRRRKQGTRDAIEHVWALWVDIDDPAGLTQLAGFHPWPSMFVRTGGGGGHAWWPLQAPLPPADAESANRRLAAHLGGDPRSTDCARVLRPAGSLNFKYDPPRPVVCTRLDGPTRALHAADVLADVPDLPAPHAGARAARGSSADRLLTLSPIEYVPRLAGQQVGRDGKLCCPLPDHDDHEPSLHCYEDPERGWHCYGCGRGGSIIDLAAELWGIEPRGDGFLEIRRRLDAVLFNAGEITP